MTEHEKTENDSPDIERALEAFKAKYLGLNDEERAYYARMVDNLVVLFQAAKTYDPSLMNGLVEPASSALEWAAGRGDDAGKRTDACDPCTMHDYVESCIDWEDPLLALIYDGYNALWSIAIEICYPDDDPPDDLVDTPTEMLEKFPDSQNLIERLNEIADFYYMAMDNFDCPFMGSRITLPDEAVSMQTLTQSLREWPPRVRDFVAWIQNSLLEHLPESEAELEEKLRASGLRSRHVPLALEQVRTARLTRTVFQSGERKIAALIRRPHPNLDFADAFAARVTKDPSHPVREALSLLLCSLAATLECTPEELSSAYGRARLRANQKADREFILCILLAGMLSKVNMERPFS